MSERTIPPMKHAPHADDCPAVGGSGGMRPRPGVCNCGRFYPPLKPAISIDVCGDVNLAGSKWIANVRAAIGGSSQAAIGVARRPSDAFAQAVGDAVEALMTSGAHLPRTPSSLGTPPHRCGPECQGEDHASFRPPHGEGG